MARDNGGQQRNMPGPEAHRPLRMVPGVGEHADADGVLRKYVDPGATLARASTARKAIDTFMKARSGDLKAADDGSARGGFDRRRGNAEGALPAVPQRSPGGGRHRSGRCRCQAGQRHSGRSHRGDGRLQRSRPRRRTRDSRSRAGRPRAVQEGFRSRPGDQGPARLPPGHDQAFPARERLPHRHRHAAEEGKEAGRCTASRARSPRRDHRPLRAVPRRSGRHRRRHCSGSSSSENT